MEFRILGPLEVVERGRAVTLGGSRQRALLALLLTRANEVVSSDRLIDELWGARPPRTAANALQYHVSQLRKTLAPSTAIVTREPGYSIRVGADEFDLFRFEQLVEEAREAPPKLASELLHTALGLWRGPPLADLSYESFAQAEILRLEELRLGALERRLEADLALARHAEVVQELDALVRENPLREGFRAQFMLALYRSGRQAEALEVYRETRRVLVDELGIEPSSRVQELERAILRHDPALLQANGLASPTGTASPPRQRAIMIVANDEERADPLLTLAEPLTREPPRELIIVRFLGEGADIASANAALAARRSALAERGVSSRVATYTTPEPGSDAVLVATQHDVDLLLVDAPTRLLEDGRADDDLGAILERAPCDVAILVGNAEITGGPVVTPFGGVEHDWSAIELAAWLAKSLKTTLRLVGTEADPARGRRDASRLLAHASLLVQQMVGIVTEPALVPTGEAGLLEAAKDARLLVIGLSDRWRTEGIGPVRTAVATHAGVPTLFVRRGIRPGGVAPTETLTRFTWTLESQQVASGD